MFPSLWLHDLSHLSFDAFLLFPGCRWLRYSTRGETSSCSGFSDRKRSDDLSIHRKIGRSVHSPENRTVRPFTGRSDGPSIHRKIGRSVHSPEDRTVHSPKLTDIGSLRSPQLLKLQIKSKVFTILLNIIQCVIPMHQYCMLYGTTTPI